MRHSMKKSEDIKVRVEPLDKRALQAIADREALDLSDIVRRAIAQFLQRVQTEPRYAS